MCNASALLSDNRGAAPQKNLMEKEEEAKKENLLKSLSSLTVEVPLQTSQGLINRHEQKAAPPSDHSGLFQKERCSQAMESWK